MISENTFKEKVLSASGVANEQKWNCSDPKENKSCRRFFDYHNLDMQWEVENIKVILYIFVLSSHYRAIMKFHPHVYTIANTIHGWCLDKKREKFIIFFFIQRERTRILIVLFYGRVIRLMFSHKDFLTLYSNLTVKKKKKNYI